MVSARRSLRLMVLFVGALLIAACDRQPTPLLRPLSRHTNTAGSRAAPTPAMASSPAIAAAVANPAPPKTLLATPTANRPRRSRSST
jgi:hypothetical protein